MTKFFYVLENVLEFLAHLYSSNMQTECKLVNSNLRLFFTGFQNHKKCRKLHEIQYWSVVLKIKLNSNN